LHRKHFLLFGTYPPPELKCPPNKQVNHGHDQKDDCDEVIPNVDPSSTAAAAAAAEEMEQLYKCIALHKRIMNGDFPMEEQIK
jgi:hypothetical protein